VISLESGIPNRIRCLRQSTYPSRTDRPQHRNGPVFVLIDRTPLIAGQVHSGRKVQLDSGSKKKIDVDLRPGKRLSRQILLTASVADHLEGCNAQISVLFFAGCLFNLPLFCLCILFCFCFAGRGAGDCHLVANMLVKLNANAA
jgi:hypothetical protein